MRLSNAASSAHAMRSSPGPLFLAQPRLAALGADCNLLGGATRLHVPQRDTSGARASACPAGTLGSHRDVAVLTVPVPFPCREGGSLGLGAFTQEARQVSEMPDRVAASPAGISSPRCLGPGVVLWRTHTDLQQSRSQRRSASALPRVREAPRRMEIGIAGDQT